ncbi:MAG: hypothetical protein F4235_01620 [Candidatus Dadabacteria bacterium]|nr:hypothetical protein [Candidatus Dadabacteria bacterium]MYE60777.1 hypothetical protein [Candidatus Dadabacteria bacterium]
MRKILVLSLLLTLFTSVSAGAEAEEHEAELSEFLRFSAYAIQSFGWKCNEIQRLDNGSFDFGPRSAPGYAITYKITCEDNLTYYMRYTGMPSNTKQRIAFCHKGTCKEFK